MSDNNSSIRNKIKNQDTIVSRKNFSARKNTHAQECKSSRDTAAARTVTPAPEPDSIVRLEKEIAELSQEINSIQQTKLYEVDNKI